MVEDTRLKSTVKNDFGDDVEENEVETLAQVPQHDNVRLPGSDVKAGELVLRQGDILDSLGGEIGTLAFVGRQEVSEVLLFYAILQFLGSSYSQARGCHPQYWK